MTNAITNVEAVGRLQEVIHSICEPLSIYLLDVIAKSRLAIYRKQDLQNEVQRGDFASLLFFVERGHWNDLLLPYGCPRELRGLANKARTIRNALSHQKYNVANYERDLENLAKLAIAIGKSDLAQYVRNKTSVQPILEEWKQLKDEGNAFFKQEQWTEAMNMYTQALKLDHHQAVLYANRALCEINLKRYQLAREDAEQAIKLDDKNVKYYRILSAALMALELPTETKAACTAGLKLDPRDTVLLLRQRDSSALEALKNYAKYNPRSLQPEPQSFDDIIAQMNQFCVTPTPPDNQIEEITDMAKHMQMNALQIEMRRLYRTSAETPNVRILSNEKRIVELCFEAIRLGNAEAQHNLGVIYGMGNFGDVLRDFVRQKEYFEKAANQKPYCRLGGLVIQNKGVAEAENGLGILYRDGVGVDVDLNKAAQYFRRSAEHGCAEGQNNFGLALLYGSGIKENQTLARAWYLKASNQGTAEAQLNYADLLANGIGGPSDITQACNYYRRAAEQGHPLAFVRLREVETKIPKPWHKVDQSDNAHFLYLQGCNYERGEGGLDKNLNLAEEYYRRAADTGLLEAELALAELLLDHFKRNKDAIPYLTRAAEKGQPLAQYRLGKLYAFGHGCEQNSNKAYRWIERAKMQGIKKKSVFDTDNTHVIDVDSAEELSKLGEELCEFERTQHISIDDMTIEERIRRYFNIIRPAAVPELPLIETNSANIFDKNLDCNLWFLKLENRQELTKRACAGSVTAQHIIDGCNLLFKGLEKIETSPIQALADFRAAYRLHDPLFALPQFQRKAQARLVVDPNDSDALFVLGRTIQRSDEERVRYFQHCVELHPLAGDFHHFLASTYMSTEKYDNALKECRRALELTFNPDWLYTEAGAFRFLNDYQKLEKLSSRVFQDDKTSSPILAELKSSVTLNTDESIKKYERFLEFNPKDHRKVPIAYYTLGLLHMWRGEQYAARNYWHKARAADSPIVRLPCFEAVDDGYDAKLVLDAWMRKDISMWNVFVDALGLTKNSACDFCDTSDPPKRCSCGEVFYCNTECQRAHWSLHKLGVEHNKNLLSPTCKNIEKRQKRVKART